MHTESADVTVDCLSSPTLVSLPGRSSARRRGRFRRPFASTSPSTRPSSRSPTPGSIDGTGAPAKNDQTILIRGEKIAAVGPAASVAVPADARVDRRERGRR